MANSKFVKFPSIEKFSDVNSYVKRYFPIEERPKVLYRGKIKLHGTNAGIRVDPDGTITGLKRTDICTVDNDNAGFANWLETVKKYLFVIPDQSYVIYGEWAGPGVQKGVAVSQIEKKTFFVFAIHWLGNDTVWVEPDLIDQYITPESGIEVLPWTDDATVEIDFKYQSSMEAATAKIAEWVNACDAIDPYVKERYGIEGIGEGFVFVPVVDQISREDYSNFIFKAKGESHSNSKVSAFKAIVPVDPVIAASVDAFVAQFVTPARVAQGIHEACAGEAVTRNIGLFMAWIGADVKKESVNELEASGLEWKQVSKAVNSYARDMFIKEIEKNV